MKQLTRMLLGAAAALALAFPLLQAPADAWVPHSANVDAVKTEKPPAADPDLADPAWATGITFKDFYDYTTHQPAEHATVAHLLYDDKNLYLSVHAEQAGVPIVAAQTVDHAGVASDDHISLNLETSGSGARVYQFRVNPKGVRDEYDSENSRFAPEWQAVTKILPDGSWNAVMIIPLSVIRAQSAAKQDWQVDVVRFVAHDNEEYTWAYDDTMQNVGSSQYWPHMVGIAIPAQSSRPRPHADFYTLGNAGSDRGVFQNGVGNFQDTKVRPLGADVTVPFTNTMAFVGTINPDFSNIEQDQTTIAPQEFQRQYSEYRPFFSQGANYMTPIPEANINSNDISFYSPKIGIFNRGLKVEGTQGLASIGLLNVIGDGSNDSVFGYGYNRPDQSFTYGLTAVDANHNGTHDETFGYGVATTNPHSGVLALLRMNQERGSNDVIGHTPIDPGQANDFQLAGGVQNAHTILLLNYRDVGPQYMPLDGYITNNDIRGPQAFYAYNGAGNKGAAIKSYNISFGADRFVRSTGELHQADVFANVSVTTKNLISLGYGDSTSELSDPVFAFGNNTPVALFNSQSLSVGYRDGTPAPIDASYSWGPYVNNNLQPIFLQQPMLMTSQQFGRWALGLMYEGNIEHARGIFSDAPALDSQWLRSLSVTRSFDKNTTLAIALRGINGTGGYATPGINLAMSFHKRFANSNEFYAVFGTPASPTSTLNRFLVKYVFHTGGATGT